MNASSRCRALAVLHRPDGSKLFVNDRQMANDLIALEHKPIEVSSDDVLIPSSMSAIPAITTAFEAQKILSTRCGKDFKTLAEAMKSIRHCAPKDVMRELDVLNKAASYCRHKTMVDTVLLSQLQTLQFVALSRGSEELDLSHTTISSGSDEADVESSCSEVKGSRDGIVHDKVCHSSESLHLDSGESDLCINEDTTLVNDDVWIERLSSAYSRCAELITKSTVAFRISFDDMGETIDAQPIDISSCCPSRQFAVHHNERSVANDLKLIMIEICGCPCDDEMLCSAIFSTLNMHFGQDGPKRLSGWFNSGGAGLSIVVDDLRGSDASSDSD